MQLDVGFFNQRNPEFLRVVARTVNAVSVVLLLFVRKQSVNDHLNPFSVLEKLERHKPSVKVLFFDDELFEVLQS